MVAEQNGLDSVLVSWNASSSPLEITGYNVTADPGVSFSAFASNQSLNITLEPGMYGIRVVSLSPQLPSEAVGPVNVTVRGEIVLTILPC